MPLAPNCHPRRALRLAYTLHTFRSVLCTIGFLVTWSYFLHVFRRRPGRTTATRFLGVASINCMVVTLAPSLVHCMRCNARASICRHRLNRLKSSGTRRTSPSNQLITPVHDSLRLLALLHQFALHKVTEVK
ncbi:hypothetical protein BD310DRAFT_563901 [Dichomitus squalens]|uniref:Uncharacterized protein n=1 Tax=Dichomitus squalens TaxID=114155 RepID=A0A4Q9PS08_9APHY|nr:hypothetical protein BD310DRAFT_563901 [Dichomitus squalens]